MTATKTKLDVPAGFVVVLVSDNYTHYHDGDNYTTGVTVTMFNPSTHEERAAHFGVGELDYADLGGKAFGNTAAREAWEQLKRERKEWSGWFDALADIGEHAVGFDRGDTVEVYRGRKVPKGSYTLLRVGDGQYGPYANLRETDGKSYRDWRFVSLDNIRHTAEVMKAKRKAAVLDNCPAGDVGETVWNFLFADSPTGEFNPEKLPFLCDFIEDGRAEGIPSEAGRWIRERFCK